MAGDGSAVEGANLNTWRRIWLSWLCVGLWVGCGAASGRVATGLPQEAPAQLRKQAERCDLGDMAACNRIGVWYHVGGGGEAQRSRGLELFVHACTNGYAPACRMVQDLKRGSSQP